MITRDKNPIKIKIQVTKSLQVGPGKILLLERIGKTGSISKAAKSIGLSYRKAWKLVNELNNYSVKKLVYAKAGGEGVRGSKLSEDGKEFIKIYRKIQNKLNKLTIKEKKDLEKLFDNI